MNENLLIEKSSLTKELERCTAEMSHLLNREQVLAENSKRLVSQNTAHNTAVESKLAECERERSSLIKLTEKLKCNLKEFETEITVLRTEIVNLNSERDKELTDALENNQRLNLKAVDKYNFVLAEVRYLDRILISCSYS